MVSPDRSELRRLITEQVISLKKSIKIEVMELSDDFNDEDREIAKTIKILATHLYELLEQLPLI